jgi:hypothetical protein
MGKPPKSEGTTSLCQKRTKEKEKRSHTSNPKKQRGVQQESPKDILEPAEMNTEETRTSPLATCNSVDRSGGSAR